MVVDPLRLHRRDASRASRSGGVELTSLCSSVWIRTRLTPRLGNSWLGRGNFAVGGPYRQNSTGSPVLVGTNAPHSRREPALARTPSLRPRGRMLHRGESRRRSKRTAGFRTRGCPGFCVPSGRRGSSAGSSRDVIAVGASAGTRRFLPSFGPVPARAQQERGGCRRRRRDRVAQPISARPGPGGAIDPVGNGPRPD